MGITIPLADGQSSPCPNLTFSEASDRVPITMFKSGTFLATRKPSEEVGDMLCPICEESCSCNGAMELVIRPSFVATSHKTSPSMSISKRQKGSNDGKESQRNKRSRPPKSLQSTKIVKTKEQKDIKTQTDLKCGFSRVRQTSDTKGRRSPRMAVHHPNTETSFSDEQRQRLEDLDQQYALSEYYFSGSEDDNESVEDALLLAADLRDDSDILAEYYGYSSGSDIALESLFLGSSEAEEEELVDSQGSIISSGSEEEVRVEEGLLYGRGGTLLVRSSEPNPSSINTKLYHNAEDLSEQLAKITPQILAAISVAAKNSAAAKSEAAAKTCYYVDTSLSQEEKPNIALRLDDLMDTKKLALILSTSPPADGPAFISSTSGPRYYHHQQHYHSQYNLSSSSSSSSSSTPTPHHHHQQHNRRPVPWDAFRRTTLQRRSSIPSGSKHIAGALKQSAMANCTLTTAPAIDTIGVEWLASSKQYFQCQEEETNGFDLTLEIEVEAPADDEDESDNNDLGKGGDLSDVTESFLGGIDVPYGHYLY